MWMKRNSTKKSNQLNKFSNSEGGKSYSHSAIEVHTWNSAASENELMDRENKKHWQIKF